MTARRLGWGIVGIGHIADARMAPAITGLPESRLVAVVSRDEGRAAAFAGRHGAPFAGTSYAAMLANPEVDAVLVTTPNAQHAEQVEAAAAAGKHVFCDKPLAISPVAARGAVEACRRAGVGLGIGFHYRRLPWARDLRDLVGKGVIGDVLVAQVEAGAGLRPLRSWRADPALAGLGTINNVGVHIYDVLRFVLADEVAEVAALCAPRGPLETMAMTLLRFERGTLAYVNANQSAPDPRADLDLYGTRGRIVASGLSRTGRDGELRILTEAGEERRPYPAVDAHRLTVDAFNRAVLGGEEPDPSGADGLRSVELTAAMAESSRSGRTVTLRR